MLSLVNRYFKTGQVFLQHQVVSFALWAQPKRTVAWMMQLWSDSFLLLLHNKKVSLLFPAFCLTAHHVYPPCLLLPISCGPDTTGHSFAERRCQRQQQNVTRILLSGWKCPLKGLLVLSNIRRVAPGSCCPIGWPHVETPINGSDVSLKQTEWCESL